MPLLYSQCTVSWGSPTCGGRVQSWETPSRWSVLLNNAQCPSATLNSSKAVEQFIFSIFLFSIQKGRPHRLNLMEISSLDHIHPWSNSIAISWPVCWGCCLCFCFCRITYWSVWLLNELWDPWLTIGKHLSCIFLEDGWGGENNCLPGKQ